MTQSHVPKIFWGDAILTTTYLVNRMPFRVLQFQTPCQVFQNSYPSSCLISSIPLKIFGCSSFVHIPQQFESKLDPKAIKCIFLSYAPMQKEYRCYSPLTKKFYHSMDVTIFENEPFYPKTNIQGEWKYRISFLGICESNPPSLVKTNSCVVSPVDSCHLYSFLNKQ